LEADLRLLWEHLTLNNHTYRSTGVDEEGKSLRKLLLGIKVPAPPTLFQWVVGSYGTVQQVKMLLNVTMDSVKM
jgi:hypothetical protein